MPFSNTGVYTPPSGATNATAGETIASATWNSIHSDISSALTSLGESNVPGINGLATARYNLPAITSVNFAATAGTDIAVFNMPTVISLYQIQALIIYNAAGSLASATVSLYTGAGATGVAVITSTATTVTTSLANTNNNFQSIGSGNIAVSSSVLFLHITTSTGTSHTASTILQITPITVT